MSFLIQKGEYTFTFEKQVRGVSLTVSKQYEKCERKAVFAIAGVGNCLQLIKGRWERFDTSIIHTIAPSRDFRDSVDRSIYYLIRTIVYLPFDNELLIFREDEYIFMEALMYELYYNPRNMTNWLPNGGSKFEFVKKKIVEIGKDGERKSFNMPAAENVTVLPYDEDTAFEPDSIYGKFENMEIDEINVMANRMSEIVW